MTTSRIADRPEITVDAHVHVWSPDLVQYPVVPNSNYTDAVRGDVEHLRGLMHASEVDRAVILQPSCYGYDHRCVSAALAAYPDTFRGVCVVDPFAPDAAAQLHARHDEGYRGLRLNPSRDDGTWLDDPMTAPIWEKAAELGTIVSLLILPYQMTRAKTMIARFPGVPVIIDHLGRPQVGLGEPKGVYADTLALAQFPNVYMKISGLPASTQEAYPYRDVWPYVQLALSHFGADRCMWATDFPWISRQCGYGACLRLVTGEMDFLAPADRRALLGDTAARLWRFEG